MDSCHGEGETRMQYQMYQCTSFATMNRPIVCLQDSSDSDNLTLALMSHVLSDSNIPQNTFVKGKGRYWDINAILRSVQANEIDPLALARLYCIHGNDFNHSIEGATTERLVYTYLRWHGIIGDLSTRESVFSLLYHTFLQTVQPKGVIPHELNAHQVMSSEWRLQIRKLIVCSPTVTSTSRLLPQDEDLDLLYRRAIIFNILEYWGKTLTYQLIVDYNEAMGYHSDGKMLMFHAERLRERKNILSEINSTCSCGSVNSVKCCDTRRCSCKKSKKSCDARCKCRSDICRNGLLLQMTAATRTNPQQCKNSVCEITDEERQADSLCIGSIVNERALTVASGHVEELETAAEDSDRSQDAVSEKSDCSIFESEIDFIFLEDDNSSGSEGSCHI